MLPRYYEFYNPVKVLSGEHALENLPYEMAHLNARRPILLTNPQLVEVGLVRILEDVLQGSDLTIAARFTEIPQDSSVHVVNAAGRVSLWHGDPSSHCHVMAGTVPGSWERFTHRGVTSGAFSHPNAEEE